MGEINVLLETEDDSSEHLGVSVGDSLLNGVEGLGDLADGLEIITESPKLTTVAVSERRTSFAIIFQKLIIYN